MTTISEAIAEYPDCDDTSREAWVLEIWELECRQRASGLPMEEWVRANRCYIEKCIAAYGDEITRRQSERSKR